MNAPQINAAFDAILRGQDPEDALERLERLAVTQDNLARFHADCIAWWGGEWGRTRIPRELIDKARAKRALHGTAARCVRRRIARAIRKGLL